MQEGDVVVDSANSSNTVKGGNLQLTAGYYATLPPSFCLVP